MISELSSIESFEKFYHHHYTAVMRYCITIVKDQTVAADIVQQAFVHLWQKRYDITIHTSSQAYLYKTIYHQSLVIMEQDNKRRQREYHFATVKPQVTTGDRSEGRELEQLIERSVNELPERCREIFLLSRYQHLRYHEIATKLNLSEKTVENQIGKALRFLRSALKEYLPTFIILSCLYHG